REGDTTPAGDVEEEIAPGSLMVVRRLATDVHGVVRYQVRSPYQGNARTIVRVLEPTSPAPGVPHRFLFVLPVQAGVTNLGSTYGDGLEYMRAHNLQNIYNLTLVAPSFVIEPWFGDHDSDPSRRLESFLVRDVVPWVDQFAPLLEAPQRWLIGFSKSGNGA